MRFRNGHARLSDHDSDNHLTQSLGAGLLEKHVSDEHGDHEAKPSRDGRQPILLTHADAVVVHVMLNRAWKLPHGVLRAILDHAEYWAQSSTEVEFGDGATVRALMDNQLIVRITKRVLSLVSPSKCSQHER
jgi:hypothetical protein